jgi:hypothetical protein
VGLSHVSNDWRITFFSRAARIWSQGLSAAAEEIANAIDPILACATNMPDVRLQTPNFGNGSLEA